MSKRLRTSPVEHPLLHHDTEAAGFEDTFAFDSAFVDELSADQSSLSLGLDFSIIQPEFDWSASFEAAPEKSEGSLWDDLFPVNGVGVDFVGDVDPASDSGFDFSKNSSLSVSGEESTQPSLTPFEEFVLFEDIIPPLPQTVPSSTPSSMSGDSTLSAMPPSGQSPSTDPARPKMVLPRDVLRLKCPFCPQDCVDQIQLR